MVRNFFVFHLFFVSACAGLTCPAGWTDNSHHGTCVKFFDTDATRWLNAKRFCRQLYGSSLVHVDSSAMAAFVVNITSGSAVWIATNDIVEEGVYRGVEGQLVRDITWASGYPTDTGHIFNCMRTTADGVQDSSCTGFPKIPYVCELWPLAPLNAVFAMMDTETFLSSSCFGQEEDSLSFPTRNKLTCATDCHRNRYAYDAFIFSRETNNCNCVHVIPDVHPGKQFTADEKQQFVDEGGVLYLME